MSATFQTVFGATASSSDPEQGHRLRLRAAWSLLLCVAVILAVYGFDYYLLRDAERPWAAKDALLDPAGRIGLVLGKSGLLLFLGVFLYPLRKRWPWLMRRGSTRHWLDFHVCMGVAAPTAILFHCSFRFRGIAGLAFWLACSVALSGIVGRYIYSQLPRKLGSAELSMKELQDLQAKLTEELAGQKVLPAAELARLFRLPGSEQVRNMPLLLALACMVGYDLRRPFQVARLRRRVLGRLGRLATLSGLLPSSSRELEKAIQTARRQASLSKRIAFLSRTQQVFHLWHVVHRPFSYSLVVLATLHIAVVVLFGYF